MFPATLETDRLEFERLSTETIEAETECLPWTPTKSVGEAADRLEEYEATGDDER